MIHDTHGHNEDARVNVVTKSHILKSLYVDLSPSVGRSYGAVVDWMDSTTYELALWERVMASPNEWVEDVLPLRMLTPAKTALK